MITYQPLVTRNCETLAKLREMAASQPLDPATRVRRGLEMAASGMAELHGGRWRTHVDHEAELAAVSRDFSATAI